MQVKDLVPGLNDVTISGRVLMTWPPQNFQRKDGTPGRVMRLTLVDKSQRVRCAIWDRHVDVLTRLGELQGKVIRIGHAYTRQGLAGDTEVHAGERSSIQVDPGDLPPTDLPEFGELFTPLAKLAVGLNQVNAVGVVQAEPRYYSFTKEDKTGSVLRILAADESGTIPFVAWNERAEELRQLKIGNILQALNGRVRVDRNGSPELHIESRSQTQILESPPSYFKPPAAAVAGACKIGEVGSQSTVDLTVSVLSVGLPQEIKRPTGEAVKLARLLVGDDSGMISLSLWDDKAEQAQELREGDTIELNGVAVRQRQGVPMLSLGKSGKMQKTDSKVTVKGNTKLNTLQQAKGLITVEGTVADTPLARQVVTERGETIDLASFTLRDDTTACRATFWREQASQVMKLRTGARVRIQGMRVRTGLNGEFELSSIPLSRLQTLDQDAKDKPAWEDIRHVIALEPGLRTWVKGVILEVLDTPNISLLCETCGSELGFTGDQLTCEKCAQPRQGKLTLSTNLRLDDGTGVVDVRLSQTDVSNLPIFNRTEIEQSIKNHSPQPTGLSSVLVGKEVEVNGTAKASTSQGKMEFLAEKLILATSL
jgi:replication factor A1